MGKSGFWKSDSFFGIVVSIVVLFAGNGDLFATTVFYSEPQRDTGLAYIEQLPFAGGLHGAVDVQNRQRATS